MLHLLHWKSDFRCFENRTRLGILYPGLLEDFLYRLNLLCMVKNKTFAEDVSIVFGGEAGQGIATIEQMCATILHKEGFHTFSVSEYMSRVRGGSNSTEIRVSNGKKNAFVERIDILFPLDCAVSGHLAGRISSDTLIIADETQSGKCAEAREVVRVPFLETAEASGGKIYLNVVMAGFVLALFEVSDSAADDFLKNKFGRKGEEVVKQNMEAVRKGWALGEKMRKEQGLQIVLERRDQEKSTVLLNGEMAISIGAVAGGCDFIASYPMSPSTGVFNGIAELSRDFDIAVEQAEDEIAAINMGLGAWYAGARAIISTSGGGFALMAEAVSLAGMIESPMVLHIAQRPGPATGLPTQTEQGDLNFVLHAGHGEFPRVILAPGTIEDGVVLTQRAFDLADKFQVPVFVLTDQFYMDMHLGAQSDMMPIEKYQKYFVETDEQYLRYKYTSDGLSPRGIPGFGKGFVCVDSDEHEENGHITESHETRVQMVDKRMARLEMIREEAILAELVGPQDFSTLIVGWGSTYGVMREAFEAVEKPGTAFLHIKQVYPLGADVLEYVGRASRVVVVENNITGQFADLLTKETGRKVDDRIVQYDGTPFSVEKLTEEFENLG